MEHNNGKPMAKIVSSIILVYFLFSNQLLASNADAFDAYKVGDYQTAAKLWTDLANDGDAEAQFNLALLYQRGFGVIADQNLSRYWLAMAARQGLAQAYRLLNKGSVAPTTKVTIPQLVLSPQQWVANQKPGYYTLQLASSTNQALIKKYYLENALQGKAGYYGSVRQGERWYALVYGAYGSVHEAKAAISNLPKDLRKWSPWVRNIRSIHKIMLKPE